ncbi:MAG: hypothetical protein HN501_00455 [Waddliaceae bacterium]|nr:hypothetical protein [Waddliaceae bacterium]
MSTFLNNISYVPPPDGSTLTTNLPFWYIYAAVQEKNGDTPTVADFNTQVTNFQGENSTFTLTRTNYNDSFWQDKFAAFLYPALDPSLLVTPETSTIQEFLRVSYLSKANLDIEHQANLLIDYSDIVEEALEILSDLTVLYNKKGGSFDNEDTSADYYFEKYDFNPKYYKKGVEIVTINNDEDAVSVSPAIVVASNLTNDYITAIANSTDTTDITVDDITNANALVVRLKALLDNNAGILGDSSLKTQLQLVYDSLPKEEEFQDDNGNYLVETLTIPPPAPGEENDDPTDTTAIAISDARAMIDGLDAVTQVRLEYLEERIDYWQGRVDKYEKKLDNIKWYQLPFKSDWEDRLERYEGYVDDFQADYDALIADNGLEEYEAALNAAIVDWRNAHKDDISPSLSITNEWVLWQELPQHFKAGETTESNNSANLKTAIAASTDRNDVIKNKLRKTLFVLDEYYKSASHVISKIHTILVSLARKGK